MSLNFVPSIISNISFHFTLFFKEMPDNASKQLKIKKFKKIIKRTILVLKELLMKNSSGDILL